MSETYAIELKNITKRFGKVTANDKVCLSVKKGEILSILGENGSGKTTIKSSTCPGMLENTCLIFHITPMCKLFFFLI